MMETKPGLSSGARPRALSGCNIVVTRPEKQAEELADLIRAEGGCAILFPTLDIIEAEDPRPLHRTVDRLEQFDLAVFVSANAVNSAMNAILARRSLPDTLKMAVVGAASRNALQRFGVKEIICPSSRHDSEALLELPQLRDVAGKNIVIFRGRGGRELLGETLVKRGARIEYLECYRRARPNADVGPLMRLWAEHNLHAITVTSSEGLRNLFEMMNEAGKTLLKRTPLFVPHPRIAEVARSLGCGNPVVTEAGDAGLMKGLTKWFAENRMVSNDR
ncbi:MAG TPA: uroporphyrinogen-III synthase [Burkholderiales bacterium]|nr:uroporphyrinogen-III synthase [Burkholderiales bacterium]